MNNISYLCTRVYGVKHPASALVAELVDAPDLGSGGSGRVGSSPIRRTKHENPENSQKDIFSGLFYTQMKGNYHFSAPFLKKT